MPTFDSAGVPIYYEVFGAGKPILLVHGLMADLRSNWVGPGWIEALSPIRRVIAMDCRGHGRSGKPHDAEAYANDKMSRDVLRLMDHLEIERADLFGYSMGAEIALPLLLRHAGRFTSVILGGIGDYAGEWDAVSAQTFLAEDASMIEDSFERGVRIFAEANDNDLKALAAYYQSYRSPLDGSERAAAGVPVLVVNGEEDTGLGSLDKLFAAVPEARLETIPHRDHLTVVPDERFKELVVEFLTERQSEETA